MDRLTHKARHEAGYKANKGVRDWECVDKLGQLENLEERLQSIYGECDGLLEKVVEHLERHEGIDLPVSVFKARLLTDGEVDRWEEFKDLEEQGKLLKMPCVVGDTVYQHMIIGVDEIKRKPIYEIFEAIVFKFSLSLCGLCFWTETADDKKYQNEVTVSAFGKTVFLTKKAAEAALKEMSEK